MRAHHVEADKTPLEREFAVRWYDGWLEAWNANKPEMVYDLLTEDFVLDSPTTRHTSWTVRGQDAAADYIRYVLAAYPDLEWTVAAPPMFTDDLARAAFSWTGPDISAARSIRRACRATGRRSSSPGSRCSTSGATVPATSTPATTCSD